MTAPICSCGAALGVPSTTSLGYGFDPAEGFHESVTCAACGSTTALPSSLQDVELYVSGLTDRAAARTGISLVRALEATLDRGMIRGPARPLDAVSELPFVCAHGRDISERCLDCERACAPPQPAALAPLVSLDARRSRGRVRTFHKRPR